MNLAGNAAAGSGIGRGDLTTSGFLKRAADQRGWEWYYCARCFARICLFSAGTGRSELGGVGPDGKHLSCSADNTIRIWDAAGGQKALILLGHTAAVYSVAWSLDGMRLASGSEDKTIKIWDAVSGREIRTLREHTNGIKSVSWSPDGKRLVSGSNDGTIKVWDTESGRC